MAAANTKALAGIIIGSQDDWDTGQQSVFDLAEFEDQVISTGHSPELLSPDSSHGEGIETSKNY